MRMVHIRTGRNFAFATFYQRTDVMSNNNPNWPSKTGNPSGPGRGNNPPKGK